MQDVAFFLSQSEMVDKLQAKFDYVIGKRGLRVVLGCNRSVGCTLSIL